MTNQLDTIASIALRSASSRALSTRSLIAG